jgi:phosphoheptose isomerase
MLINFENIEGKCHKAASSPQYHKLVEKVNKVKKIFLIGNGGLHYVASHMSTDLSRLIPGKAVYSFDSVGFITSNANDHGYDKIFIRWLETMTEGVDIPEECLIIGLSCSGNSGNVIDALHWAEDNGYGTFMVSGQTSEILRDDVDELNLNCKFFHTVEVMCLMIFYDLIHRTGNHCPSIRQEKERLSDSPLRMANKETSWEPL